MFARGAVPGRVYEWSYGAEEEDFTKGDSPFLLYQTIFDVKP